MDSFDFAGAVEAIQSFLELEKRKVDQAFFNKTRAIGADKKFPSERTDNLVAERREELRKVEQEFLQAVKAVLGIKDLDTCPLCGTTPHLSADRIALFFKEQGIVSEYEGLSSDRIIHMILGKPPAVGQIVGNDPRFKSSGSRRSTKYWLAGEDDR